MSEYHDPDPAQNVRIRNTAVLYSTLIVYSAHICSWLIWGNVSVGLRLMNQP
jgi:hypothetical protein